MQIAVQLSIHILSHDTCSLVQKFYSRHLHISAYSTLMLNPFISKCYISKQKHF